MKTHTTHTQIFVLAGALTLTAFIPAASVHAVGIDLKANAQVNTTTASTSVKVDAKLATRIETGKNRATQEIDRRIEALNALNTRIGALVRVGADEKARFSNSIQAQITELATLKAKISADTDIETLKADVKSITDSYRIFKLVIPQGHVIATIDSIVTEINMLASLGAKLETRIKALESSGTDVKSLMTLLTDMSVKITDAKVQADAAFKLTASLIPDNGDKAKMKANDDALASARAKIKIARSDFEAARKDAHKIVTELKKTKVKTDVSATSTTRVQ